MKKIIAFAMLLALHGPSYAQTEQDNHEKYWTYRNNLIRKFLKIGASNSLLDFGNSIPIENRDNINTNCTGTGKRMRWGDATIHQGYYIATLACEYELLRRSGKDCAPTLNELYYAIQAVDRLDDYAEWYLSLIPNLFPNKNGFLTRDDVPGAFSQYFQDPPPDYVTCISSGYYDTENGSVSNNFWNDENEMSQDQIYGLFLGFSFVKKFVDPSLVIQPTPQDLPVNLVLEVQQITDRIMNYVTQQWSESASYWAGPICQTKQASFTKNWVIKNPITQHNVTRGADMSLLAPFVAEEAHLITGNVYNANVSRSITFPGIEPHCFIAQPFNPSVSFPLSTIMGLWTSLQSSTWNNITVNFSVPLFDMPLMISSGNVPNININLSLGNIPFDNSNRHMVLSLVACTNSFTKNNTGALAWSANMPVFDLVRSVLHGGGPFATQQDFLNLLNTAPCEGTHSYVANNPAPWHSPGRWWMPDGSGFTGEYNGLDYMFLYDLYMLEYGNFITNIIYKDESCPCPSVLKKIDPFIDASQHTLIQPVTLDRKFPEYVDFENSVKEYLTQSLTLNSANNLTLQTELVVCNNSQLTVPSINSLILGEPTGDIHLSGMLRIRNGSQLKVENTGEVILHPNSKIIIEKGATFILKQNSKLVINDNASVTVEEGANFIWDDGPEILLQGAQSLFDQQSNSLITVSSNEKFYISKGIAASGGVMKMQDGTMKLEGILHNEDVMVQFQNTSSLQYVSGADIRLCGNNAVLSLESNLDITANSKFTFSYPNSISGHLRLGNLNMIAGNNSQFQINGQGQNDLVIEVTGDVVLPDNLTAFVVTSGMIQGNHAFTTGAVRISTGCNLVYLNKCTCRDYTSLTFYGQHVVIANTDFINNETGVADYDIGNSHYNPVFSGCTFSNCMIPVITSGIGIVMGGCTISNNATGWLGGGITYNSYINNSHFTDNNSAAQIHLEYDAASPALVMLNKSYFTNSLQTGAAAICASGGTLLGRCNVASGNYGQFSSAIKMEDNGLVNLSDDFGGGYNDLAGNSSLMELKDSYAEINNGMNVFSIPQNNPGCYIHAMGCDPFITGSISGISCNGSTHILQADHNDWGSTNSNLFSANSHAFQLEVASSLPCTDQVYYYDNFPGTQSACPLTYNGPLGNSSSPLVSGAGVSKINTTSFKNTYLHNAVNFTLGLMDTTVVMGYKTAAGLFTELLNFPISNPTNADQYILDMAYRKLLECMSQSSYYGHVADTITSLHNDVLILQQHMIDYAKNKGNYHDQLYTSMDQAAIYRLGGDFAHAASCLQNILAWVHPDNLEYVENWLCYYQNLHEVDSKRITRNEFAERTALCYPSGNSHHPDKRGNITETINEESRSVTVYPNPNTGSFTISTAESIISMQIINMLGETVYEITPGTRHDFQITGLDKGIYLLKINGKANHLQVEKIAVH